MTHTIIFNGKQSMTSYGIDIESVQIGPPVPRKTEITIPFVDSTIDMEEIVGKQTYDDRTITVKMWKKCISPQAVRVSQNNVEEWLFCKGKQTFRDSSDIMYSYMASCTQIDFAESTAHIMRCTATFKADPYKTNIATGKKVI